MRTKTDDEGTIGFVTIDGKRYCTLELPDRDNANRLSCIPAGTYICRWTYSNAFKKHMYLVDGVPKRAGIRIHSAAFAGDTTKGYKSHLLGCIALGKGYGTVGGQRAILSSRAAMSEFNLWGNQQPFKLIIKWSA